MKTGQIIQIAHEILQISFFWAFFKIIYWVILVTDLKQIIERCVATAKKADVVSFSTVEIVGYLI